MGAGEMRTSKFSDQHIDAILREHASGASPAEICRKYKISSATFYKWKAKAAAAQGSPKRLPAAPTSAAMPPASRNAGPDTALMKRIKSLEDENARLRNMLVEALLEAAILKDRR